MRFDIKKRLRTLFTVIGLLVMTMGMVSCSNLSADGVETEISASAAESTLKVHYLDIGQGDATLIVCDGHAMLIDAGDNNKGTAVQAYLKSQKIESIDYVIGTHPDADHIGGLDVIITKFDCGTIFLTDETKDTNTYRDVIDAMKYKSYQKTVPQVGETYVLGEAEFTIVGPSELNSDSNDNSIAIILRHGSVAFYFEGDAGEKEETAIIDCGIKISADVYKIGHHGSKTSTSDEMLQTVSPAYAVISVGDNSYGHPNAAVLNKLRAANIQVFRTDEQGTIVATSDGTEITWNMQPDIGWQAGEPTASSGDDEEDSQVTKSDNNSGSASDIMVHITATGEKYHSAGCEYLGKSDEEVTLEEAKAKGLTPCSKCNPPQT